MASLTRRGDVWRLRWTRPDGRKRERRIKVYAVAKELHAAATLAEQRGEDFDPFERRGPVGIGAPLGEWLTERARVLRPGPLRVLRSHIGQWLQWSGVRFLDRDSFDLGGFYDACVAKGNTTRTAAKKMGEVHRFWVWCWEHDDYGPLVRRPRKPDVRVDPPPRKVAPTWAQMDAVIAVGLASRAPWYGRAMLVARCQGLRFGQVRRLRWSDVQGDRLHIRGELGKSKAERQGRVVPLAPVLLEAMADWPRGDTLVGTGGAKQWQRKLRTMWAAAGVPEQVWRGQPGHAFRHGWSSGMAALGVTEELRAVFTGHAGASMQAQVYTDRAAIWPALVEAAARVPPVSGARPEVVELWRWWRARWGSAWVRSVDLLEGPVPRTTARGLGAWLGARVGVDGLEMKETAPRKWRLVEVDDGA